MSDKKSQAVITDPKNKNVSRLVTAMQMIGNECKTKNDGQFGRVAEIISDKVKLKMDEFDFEFNCSGDDDLEANEAEIIIYNLSNKTAKLFKKDNNITIKAGYKSDTGVIFEGVIVKVRDGFNGVDRTTTIRIIDGQAPKEKKVESITYAGGTKASYILQDLIKRAGLTTAVFKIKRDYTYKDKTTVDGDIIPKIADYAKVCGISVYINKKKIYARSIKEGDDIQFTVSADTGLIGSPTEFEEEETVEDFTDTIHGYEFDMLLQHRMTTGAIITLKSRNVNGKFRVKSWEHKGNETEFTTHLKVVDA